MVIKRTFVLLGLVLLVFVLAACELSASTPPPTTLTGEGPMGTLQSELGNIATQTALAGGSSINLPTTEAPAGGGQEATATPEPTKPPVEEPSATRITAFTATPGIPASWQLKKGEHPFCIARRFNVNQYELLNINGLSLSSKPAVGFNLKIPQTGNHFVGQLALRAHPTTHTVAAGDSIYSIACQYGNVDPNAIIQVNDLKSDSDIKSGDKLDIP